MDTNKEREAQAGGEVVAGFVPPASSPQDRGYSAAPAADRTVGFFDIPGLAPTPAPEGEYTPDWLKQLGGRKFVLTVLVVVAFAVLIGLGIEVPDWFTALVGGLGASFNIGAGLARSGGR